MCDLSFMPVPVSLVWINFIQVALLLINLPSCHQTPPNMTNRVVNCRSSATPNTNCATCQPHRVHCMQFLLTRMKWKYMLGHVHCIRGFTSVCTHTHTHTRAHTCAHTHTHTNTHTHTHTRTHTLACALNAGAEKWEGTSRGCWIWDEATLVAKRDSFSSLVNKLPLSIPYFLEQWEGEVLSLVILEHNGCWHWSGWSTALIVLSSKFFKAGLLLVKNSY